MFQKLMSRPERRHRKRQLLNTSVRVFTNAGPMEAVGLNISEGGMGLFTVAHIPVGSRIEIEFRTPDGPTSFMRLFATVRHRALYLYGVQFEQQEENDVADREHRQKKVDTHPPYQA